ncbi:MAG: peroxidase family protein [Candidatus Binataceae bacterium]|jgi:hypothetical protein
MSAPEHSGPAHGTRLMRGLDRFAGLKANTNILARALEGSNSNTPALLIETPPAISIESGRFGRIFPASKYAPTAAAIHDLAQSTMEPNNPTGDNPNIALGFTFLGQFVDHDLTLDATSLFGASNDPDATVDFRTPNFDLDNLYGSGPGVSRQMYDLSGSDGKNPVKLLIDAGRDFDLPRNSQNSALIGDLRNDENFLVSQLHLGFMKFHNAVVDLLRSSSVASNYNGLHGNMFLFKDASDLVRRHYQWILIHEFLPTILGQDVVSDVLTKGPKLYNLQKLGAKFPFMPVEFSTAAYRLGHTMLRQDYIINATIHKDLFDLPVFGSPRVMSSAEKIDFTGFFDFPGKPAAQRARKFDAKFTIPVFTLPFIDTVQDPPPSLPERNMLRGLAFNIPSGQEVGNKMKALGLIQKVYSNAELGIDSFKGLNGEAPLFFYIMKESEFPPSNGLHLGPVGARLVAEVFIELLSSISGNFLHDDPSWTPAKGIPSVANSSSTLPLLPAANSGKFTMVDLLTFAKA